MEHENVKKLFQELNQIQSIISKGFVACGLTFAVIAAQFFGLFDEPKSSKTSSSTTGTLGKVQDKEKLPKFKLLEKTPLSRTELVSQINHYLYAPIYKKIEKECGQYLESELFSDIPLLLNLDERLPEDVQCDHKLRTPLTFQVKNPDILKKKSTIKLSLCDVYKLEKNITFNRRKQTIKEAYNEYERKRQGYEVDLNKLIQCTSKLEQYSDPKIEERYKKKLEKVIQSIKTELKCSDPKTSKGSSWWKECQSFSRKSPPQSPVKKKPVQNRKSFTQTRTSTGNDCSSKLKQIQEYEKDIYIVEGAINTYNINENIKKSGLVMKLEAARRIDKLMNPVANSSESNKSLSKRHQEIIKIYTNQSSYICN